MSIPQRPVGEEMSKGAIADVAAELDQISTFNDVVRAQLQGIIETTEMAAFGIVERLHAIDREVIRLEQVAMAGDTTAGLARISEKLLDANAHIQFQDVVRQQVELVMQALKQFDEHAGQLAARLRNPEMAPACTPIAQRLATLYSSYVMDQQRSAHDAALRRDSPEIGDLPNPVRTELF